jgi:hypothetical protein
MEAVETDRHPGTALVRTIDSVSARHDTLGTTHVLGRNVRTVRVVMTRAITLPPAAPPYRLRPDPSMKRFVSRVTSYPIRIGRRSPAMRAVFAAALALASATSACAAQRSAPPLVMAALGDDAAVTIAFRTLLDDVIGDSADKICVSVATSRPGAPIEDADPSPPVLRALRAGGARTTVLPRSACAADERNFGNPRGLLRLKDVARLDEHTLIAHADAVGDHIGHYVCFVPLPSSKEPGRCRITGRD